MSPSPIPAGYHAVTAYLIFPDASAAIDFYKRAFGAVEIFRMPGSGGKIMHAEIKIGDSHVMLADENLSCGARSATTIGGSPISFCLYVEDSGARTEQAVAAGATIVRPLQDQFYGDRTATVADPFGYQWTISTHTEDVSPDEIARRAAAFMADQK